MKAFCNLSLIAVLITAVFLVSCSEKSEVENDGIIEFLPFQTKQDGRWGMISPDGKVLFTEKFKNEPTVARDGRFFVKNEEGLWDMYTATENPQKIASSYTHVSSFKKGRAIVAWEGWPVSIIDTQGKQVKLIDKIDGKVVNEVYTFHENHAVFMTDDSLFGAIDMDGNCVVKPQYRDLCHCCDGKFIGKNATHGTQDENTKYFAIDLNGKILFEFGAGSSYKYEYPYFSDGLLCVFIEKEGFGLINDKGELVNKLHDIVTVTDIYRDKIIYWNRDICCGVMNTKGEIIISPEFGVGLFFVGTDILGKENGDGGMGIDAVPNEQYIDINGNQIGDETYVQISSFINGEYAIVKPDWYHAYIIDKYGKQIDGLPDMFDIGTNEGDNIIESGFNGKGWYISTSR